MPLRAARLSFSGDVPRGSGLSSSAALEAALCLALLAVAGAEEPDRTELAKLCSRVENDWVGAETGLLDQLAGLRCEPDHALRIDFATLDLEPVPLDLGGWRLATVDSGAEHFLAAGGYNERRAECRAACAALGMEHLSQAGAGAAAALPEPLARRARHVLSENARVDATVAALRAHDLPEVGRLLDASHASLRDDYEASVPEVEHAVARCKAAGRGGRAHGRRRLRRLGAGPVRPGRGPARRRDPGRARPARAPPLVRRGRSDSVSASSSCCPSGRVKAQIRKIAAVTSSAIPTDRFRFQPAALSISASEAPEPEHEQDHPVDREQATDDAPQVEQVRGARGGGLGLGRLGLLDVGIAAG